MVKNPPDDTHQSEFLLFSMEGTSFTVMEAMVGIGDGVLEGVFVGVPVGIGVSEGSNSVGEITEEYELLNSVFL